MRALCFVGLLACGAEHPAVGPQRAAPRTFCTAITHADLQAASWATTTKLASIGARGDRASEQLLRAWLYTQPCVVGLEVAPCVDRGVIEIEAIVRAPNPDAREQTQRVLIRLQPESAATIDWVGDCRPAGPRRVKTFHFD